MLPTGWGDPRLQVIDTPAWGWASRRRATLGAMPVIWELSAITNPLPRIRTMVDASFCAEPEGMVRRHPRELADALPVRGY